MQSPSEGNALARSRAALARAGVIDVHAHVVLADTMQAAGSYGPELGCNEDGTPWFRVGDYCLHGVRYEGSPFMDPELRIAAMDRAGIDMQVLSPNPLTYFHFIPAEEATAFCRRHNDALAALVARFPERFAGFAAVPMQDTTEACAELRRAVEQLGLLGPYIGTDFGRHLNDPGLDPFYATVADLDVPLFIHPGPAGIDGPPGDRNLRQFDLDIIVGFAAQETIAVATLIYGEVLERHPKLDICISHAGGAIVALIGRLEAACQKRSWAPAYLQREGAFQAQLRRLWFDAHVHDARVAGLVIELLGTERLVLGTNFAGWDQGETTLLGERAATLGANAKRLLRASP
ncbi:MAG: amidohydrolase family protein [Pseudomonadota bacterium]